MRCLKVINGFMAKADGKDKLTALVQVRINHAMQEHARPGIMNDRHARSSVSLID
jgi:hypothetical protein